MEPVLDFSTLSPMWAGALIVAVIAVMWIFPFSAFLLFRYLNKRGEKREPEEIPHTSADEPAVFNQNAAVGDDRETG